MNRTALVFATCLGAVMAASASADVRVEYSTVNKSIDIRSNETAGDVDSVNGSIRIGDFATVGDVESVNGSIRIGQGVQARSIDSVNGGIHLEGDVTVDGKIETVNGGIDAERGVRITGGISTVNGTLDLDKAIVEGDVTTYNGSVLLRNGTSVAGDLHVKKSRNSGWSLFDNKNKPVTVELGDDSIIQGDLYFERPVRLRVGSGAQYGRIHGDEVELIERK